MHSLNQTYKALAIPHFKEVFEIVDDIMMHHQVPYYLIGVSAIALELLKKGVKPSRGTKDIDFAIMISSINEYQNLSDSLVKAGFNKVKAPWTFYHERFNIVIDLLPFGEIEEQDTAQFNERYTDLHVLGFKEVLEHPDKVQIEEMIVNIPPLPGMVVLKLVAWSDRPEERENDLSDILRIIEHYFEHNLDEIVEFHHDTFPEDGFDPLIVSAEILGRNAKSYIEKSDKLSERITRILKNALEQNSQSAIAREWARRRDWPIEYALNLIEAFQKGITK